MKWIVKEYEIKEGRRCGNFVGVSAEFSLGLFHW
jgi:hypothetical protein